MSPLMKNQTNKTSKREKTNKMLVNCDYELFKFEYYSKSTYEILSNKNSES